MKNLKQTKLVENICQQRKAYSNRPLQIGGIIPINVGRAMVENIKKNKRAKTEALIKCLDEKLRK